MILFFYGFILLHVSHIPVSRDPLECFLPLNGDVKFRDRGDKQQLKRLEPCKATYVDEDLELTTMQKGYFQGESFRKPIDGK